jgi:hypothetical protein
MDTKNRQREYRNSLKEKGCKLLAIPLHQFDIDKAMEITGAENMRDAVLEIFLKGLGVQQELLQPITADVQTTAELEELKSAINKEFEAITAEIEELQAAGKNWRKNQNLLGRLAIIEKLRTPT